VRTFKSSLLRAIDKAGDPANLSEGVKGEQDSLTSGLVMSLRRAPRVANLDYRSPEFFSFLISHGIALGG